MVTIYDHWLDSYGRRTCVSKHFDAQKLKDAVQAHSHFTYNVLL